MSDDGWWLGPLGNLQPIKAPTSGQDAAESETGIASRLITGRVHIQRRIRAREYPLRWDVIRPDDFSVIDSLARGVFGLGPHVLLDPMRRNRLAGDPSGVIGDPAVVFTAMSSLVTSGAPRYGARSAAWSILTGTAAGARLQPRDTTRWAPVIPGEQLTASLYAQGTGVSVAAALVWLDAAGLFMSVTSGAAVTPGASWVRLSATATPPAGAALVATAATTGSSPSANATILVDQLQLEAGPGGLPWVLGSSAPRLAFISAPIAYPLLGWLSATANMQEV